MPMTRLRTAAAAAAAAALLATPAAAAAAGPPTPPPARHSAAVTYTATQAAFLQRWAGEEKRAGDLYRALAAKYPTVGQFAAVAHAEDNHLGAVRALMAAGNVADPTAGTGPGVFADPALAASFKQLRASATSRQAALAAAASVERADVADLSAGQALFATTSAPARVLRQQVAASNRHLRAFTR